MPPSCSCPMPYWMKSFHGPTLPNAGMDNMMTSGRIALSTSYPSPRRSINPARKFSMTTSLMLTSSSMIALPFGCRISAVTPSLLMCSVLNQPLRFHGSSPRSPSGRLPEPTIMRCGSQARIDSTLMTSAPMSASSFVACGPAHIREKSRTRTPSSAPPATCESFMCRYPFPAEYPHVSLLGDNLNT